MPYFAPPSAAAATGGRTVVTYTASPAFDGTLNGSAFEMTLTGAVAPSITNITDNFTYTIWFIQDATGGRVVTWPGTWKWLNGTPMVLSTTASAVDSVTVLVRGTTIYAVPGKAFA